jgi:dihydroxyacetone kinase
MLAPSGDEHIDQVDVQQSGRRGRDLADSRVAGGLRQAFQGAVKVLWVGRFDPIGYGVLGVCFLAEQQSQGSTGNRDSGRHGRGAAARAAGLIAVAEDPAGEIVDELLDAVVTDLPFGRGDDVALMVNGLGGTPISELYLLYGYAHEILAQRGINVRRNYVGNYCTSLDMAGTSITLSRLDPETEELLAAPAEIAIRTF